MLRSWVSCALTILSAALVIGCSAPASGTAQAPTGARTPVPTMPSGDAAGHLSAAEAAVSRNDLSTAAREYRDAAVLDPGSAEAQFGLGNVYVRQSRFPEAVAAYRAALALDPGMAAAQTNLGRTYYEMGQLSKAAEALGAALKLDPEDGKTLYMMAVVRLQENDLREAEELLIKARTADPNLPEVYYGLGVLYRLKGQKQDAVSAFEKFLAVGPGQDPGAMAHARQELESLQGN
jgi:tetratricopeptide (TPR) repeat protein